MNKVIVYYNNSYRPLILISDPILIHLILCIYPNIGAPHCWLQLTEFCISCVMLAVNEVRAMLTDAVEATVPAGIPPPVVAATLITTGGVGRF